jgi:succinate-acetate transporter protein
MFICSFRTNLAVMAVFGVLFLTFVFLALGELNASTSMTKAGGYLGLLTALLAWYASFAGVMNATAKRAILPVFPR